MKKLIIPLILILSGCTKTVAEMNYSERQELAAKIGQRCVEQGVAPSSSEYQTCIKIEAEREVATRERRARVRDAIVTSNSVCTRNGNTVVCY